MFRRSTFTLVAINNRCLQNMPDEVEGKAYTIAFIYTETTLGLHLADVSVTSPAWSELTS